MFSCTHFFGYICLSLLMQLPFFQVQYDKMGKKYQHEKLKQYKVIACSLQIMLQDLYSSFHLQGFQFKFS